MSFTSRSSNKDRRGFLKFAAATGGAVAVTGIARAHLAEPRPESPETEKPDAAPQAGYRETDHIREYYDKARF